MVKLYVKPTLLDKIKNVDAPIDGEMHDMTTLVSELIGKERATSGNREELAAMLNKYNISYKPDPLPNKGYHVVTLNRAASSSMNQDDNKPFESTEGTNRRLDKDVKKIKQKVIFEDGHISIYMEMDKLEYNQIKQKTLQEILDI